MEVASLNFGPLLYPLLAVLLKLLAGAFFVETEPARHRFQPEWPSAEKVVAVRSEDRQEWAA
ncbi:MAG: hypothetical protein AAF555_06535 [Verrucomicrobiota bacterium]